MGYGIFWTLYFGILPTHPNQASIIDCELWIVGWQDHLAGDVSWQKCDTH